ncbi:MULTISPECIES: cytochrome b/b6 domain-containing protein [Nitrospirillum]|uniref:Cytochrome b n=1 Tax=Nitrospirillum amazonense TaxID=28077 RepID=A0A560G9Y5_9PROT|nr:cytochrome b/b6 domain-containing protein [Nitrospirillum amazonense]MEC4591298.1 cytochrome b/b6 domain-containing protein [Nitrospirillum amazonense]TWB30713.1 cytochrome b [Nitrospirillum amazonense]
MAPKDQGGPPGERIPIWDLPIRLFHWLLVADLAGLWWTATHDNLALHFKLGYAALALLLFRLFWGGMGSDQARFARFLKGPAAVLSHLRHVASPGPLPPQRGHNALGGWAVVVLLLVLLAQVGTGLFAVDDDGMEEGPLAHRVGASAAKLARRLHHANFSLIQIVVAVHVAAVLFYLVVKRENLVRPMITGWKRLTFLPGDGAGAGDSDVGHGWVPLWHAGVLAAVAAGLVAGLVVFA